MMGHVAHHAIVVTGKEAPVRTARGWAMTKQGMLVSDVVPAHINGYASFFVAPDGSKEGWETSDEGNRLRTAMVKYLQKRNLDFVEVCFGGDEDFARVESYNS